MTKTERITVLYDGGINPSLDEKIIAAIVSIPDYYHTDDGVYYDGDHTRSLAFEVIKDNHDQD